MENFLQFLRAVLSHWGWLGTAVIALVLYRAAAFGGDTKIRMVLILIAIGSILMALYLTVSDQLTILNGSLEIG
jgi:hypothetical protein